MKNGAAFLLALALFALAGCGTVCNFAVAPFSEPDGHKFPAVYGGVQLDAAVMSSKSQLVDLNGIHGEGPAAAVLIGCVLAEFPLTFIGDTLTLPITLWIERRRNAARDGLHGTGAAPVEPAVLGDVPSTASGSFEPVRAK
jgi:uncharacterized protein YceK